MANLLDLFIHLRQTYPDELTGDGLRQNSSRSEFTTPLHLDGYWQLDVTVNGRMVNVIWKEDHGFGVTLLTDDTGYGSAPDWHSKSLDETKARCEELLT